MSEKYSAQLHAALANASDTDQFSVFIYLHKNYVATAEVDMALERLPKVKPCGLRSFLAMAKLTKVELEELAQFHWVKYISLSQKLKPLPQGP